MYFPVRFAIFLGVSCFLFGYLYSLFNYLQPQMDGSSSAKFKHAVHTYKDHIQKNTELGSSFSVYYHGEHVVDIVGGYVDKRFRLPWITSTISQLFTVSMVVIPFTFAKLYQDGLLDIQSPIQHYLPQFVVDSVTVSDLLTHQSGFPYFIGHVSLAKWRDDYRNALNDVINQIPPILPKTQVFHLHSMALLSDAIVRKVDHKKRTLARYFMEEIAWPLGLDMLIGIPRTQLYRAARTYHANTLSVFSSILHLDLKYAWTNLVTAGWLPYSEKRNMVLNVFSDYEFYYNWNPDLLEVPLVSSHLFTNARNLARLFTLLENSNGSQTHSKPFVIKKSIRNWMLQVINTSSYDPVLLRHLQLTSSGFMVTNSPKNTLMFGIWDDILGQGVFIDPHLQLTWAYVTNHAHGCSLDSDFILNSLIDSVYSCIDK
ncbi:Beta-lactamase domain-containing protein isoform 3 [Schistosoma japonicum]|uniref:Beta-lactamase domain-containing protein isoform 3 n=1 Tax=Schistosoma japonicum TaxID=6182 RepID=A0A4Z2CQD9_SCHJA|nr:Beta-lactamase domain-containing protein 2 [Schistosoma japonicum]KAH8852210.1 Beta-lactamase domain-containing protein 2 [Schistosoma japonicum]TNN06477.1 Beta-lactamase domain-containing protein isoform 3 [Schistosoma japonicum]TNN06480.1 Beta-lactamase domain-containing protein isoform 3 [Schistosoma japonicum]